MKRIRDPRQLLYSDTRSALKFLSFIIGRRDCIKIRSQISPNRILKTLQHNFSFFSLPFLQDTKHQFPIAGQKHLPIFANILSQIKNQRIIVHIEHSGRIPSPCSKIEIDFLIPKCIIAPDCLLLVRQPSETILVFQLQNSCLFTFSRSQTICQCHR